MSYLNNFLFRVKQYAYENRAKLIKALVIAAGALLVALLIYHAAEYVASVRSQQKINALEALERDASARAKEHQAQAELLKSAIETKYIELHNLRSRAESAETALRNAKSRVVTLREEYETIRYRDVPDTPVSVADACAKLSGLGYKCG